MGNPLATLRAASGGPFTRAQALAAGMSAPEIRRMLARGAFVSLRRGVYVEEAVRARASQDDRRAHALEIAALRLALGCDAVAGGTSAAYVLGLEALRGPREYTLLTEDDTRRCRQRDGYLLRVVALPSHHRELRFGVPVTSPARTVVTSPGPGR